MPHKKGKVYIQTTKGVFPYSVLKKAQEPSSKQVKESEHYSALNELVPYPYSPNMLLTLYESNAILFRCVNQLAIDVAGLGWNLHLKEGISENKAEFERLNLFLQLQNNDDGLHTLLKQLVIDWGSVGWFGIEVIRDNTGTVAEIYHVPAHTFRMHQSKEKFCQIRDNKKVWFKKFGLDNKNFSSNNGKEGTFDINSRANELIYYRNFYPKSDYYGVPNFIAATGDVMGLIGLRDYNLAFFENYGIPSAMILLEGDWEKGSDKTITEFLNNEFKGCNNAHRTLVVTQAENCKFTYIPLNSQVKEGSFKLYEQSRREDILIAYSMPPERIGIRITGSLGGNVAEEATRIYVQSVVEPLQIDLEDIINKKLLQSEIYEFKFENIDLRNYNEEILRMNSQIEHGILTPNEARQELGYKPYPEGDKFFILSSLLEVGETEEDEE